jgi:Holliday junction resolvase
MSGMQRRKGANGERELCALLNDNLGTAAKRLLGQARDGGHDVPLKPFRIEVKRRARLAIYEWWEQVNEGRELGEIPIIAMRADQKQWLLVMDLPTFCKLAREEISK